MLLGMADGDTRNKCLIKYLYLAAPAGGMLHQIEDYEFHTTGGPVHHRIFEELRREVLAHCPRGYVCQRPIAMHHELIWQFHKEEKDQLFQPIFDQVDPWAYASSCENF